MFIFMKSIRFDKSRLSYHFLTEIKVGQRFAVRSVYLPATSGIHPVGHDLILSRVSFKNGS